MQSEPRSNNPRAERTAISASCQSLFRASLGAPYCGVQFYTILRTATICSVQSEPRETTSVRSELRETTSVRSEPRSNNPRAERTAISASCQNLFRASLGAPYCGVQFYTILRTATICSVRSEPGETTSVRSEPRETTSVWSEPRETTSARSEPR